MMEILFENSYLVTKERYLDWAKHPIKKNHSRIVLITLTILMLFLLVTYIFEKDSFVMIFFILITAFCLYRGFSGNILLSEMQFKSLSLSQEAQEWERIIRFTDCISVMDGNTTSEYQWNQIVRLIDKKQYLILVFNNRLGIRLDKTCFTQGTCEDFLKYVNTNHHIRVSVQK